MKHVAINITNCGTEIRTLDDIRLYLPAAYNPASTERYRGDLARVEKLAKRRLHQIPADEAGWQAIADGFVWAGEFKNEDAFRTWVKRIISAMRAVRKAVQLPDQSRAATKPAWKRVIEYGQDAQNSLDETGRLRLPNMASASLSTLQARLGHVHPAEINFDVVTKALQSAPANKKSSLRNAVRLYDKMIGEAHYHSPISDLLPKTPIGPLPGLRHAPMDWSRFDETFRAELERMIKRYLRPEAPGKSRHGGRLGPDPLAGRRGRKKKKRITNAPVARKAIIGALSWLIRHAYPDRGAAYALASPQDLVSDDVIQRATAVYITRAAKDPSLKPSEQTASGTSYLARLKTFAERNDLPEHVVWAIEDAMDEDGIKSFQAREMSATRDQFVKLIERDPAVVRAIVTGPRELNAWVCSNLARWESLGERSRQGTLQMSAIAAALSLQLARPLRTLNVHEIMLGGELPELMPPGKNRTAWLDLGRSHVKNRRPIEGPIPEARWCQIRIWIEEARPKWCKLHDLDEDTIYMFPSSRRNEGFICRQTFNKWWNKGMAMIGVPGLTPHMMRHVCVTIYLAKHPGDYPTVAALLGDKVTTVEKFYARGEGAAAMRVFAEVLAEIEPSIRTYVGRRAA